jgi:hypothetical protein
MSCIAAMAAMAATLAACTSAPAPSCNGGEQISVHDTLYFGTATPDGIVSADEWTSFLNDAVTPRFPQGLSVWQASGQWRSADGTIVREASHVLDLVHASDESSDRAVREIVAAYKARFHQEAVLRVRTPTCLSL